MKCVLLVAALVACGAKQPTQSGSGSGSAEPVGVVKDTRTPIERRRDAACDQLAPKLTQCVVEDAKRDFANGKESKADFDKDIAPGVLKVFTEKWLAQCKVPITSRQVRVYEVCFKAETECDPLLACLHNVNVHPEAGAANGSGAK